ncbi:MAG: hypothetical protein ACOX6V_04930 [Patescibacteria group bacterium]|jgi:hypothetical protein
MTSSEQSFTEHLKTGLLIAGFAFFAGISLTWMQWRGIEEPEVFLMGSSDAKVKIEYEDGTLADNPPRVGQVFAVNVVVDPSENHFLGLDAAITYSPTDLEFLSVNPMSIDPKFPMRYVGTDISQHTSQTNKILTSILINVQDQGFVDERKVLHIEFRRLTANETRLMLLGDPETVVAVEEVEGNALGQTVDLTIGATVADDAALCESGGGVWSTMVNSCADLCGREGMACLQVITEGCDCGDGKCWNGSKCISEPLKPVFLTTTLRAVFNNVMAIRRVIDAEVIFRSNPMNTELTRRTVRFTVNEEGIFVSDPIEDIFVEGLVYDLIIKGPNHVETEFTQVVGASEIDLTYKPILSLQEQFCINAGGTWRTDFPNTCVDNCGTEGMMCGQAITAGCDCPHGCWNSTTQSCVGEGEDSNSPVVIPEATLRVKFAGVNKKPGLTINARVIIRSHPMNTELTRRESVRFIADSNGVFVSEPLTNLFYQNLIYDIRIKGPKHFEMEYEYVYGASEMDLTKYPILPGDLPITKLEDGLYIKGEQDGRISIDDYWAITDRLNSSAAEDLEIADINYSGKVTEDDISLFLGTLFRVIDPSSL